MKSDSFIKMIAGAVVLSLFVNISNSVVYTGDEVLLNSAEPEADYAVALDRFLNMNSDIKVVNVESVKYSSKAVEAKVEAKESDVSREQDQFDIIDGHINSTENNNIMNQLTSRAGNSTLGGTFEYSALTKNSGAVMAASDAKTAEESKASTDNKSSKDTTNKKDDTKATSKKNIETSKYADLGVFTADDYVNIRKKASTDSGVAGKLYKGSTATIISEKDGWYSVKSGSVKGYIKKGLLVTGLSDSELVKLYGKKSITVKTTTLNVRTEAKETADIVTQVSKDESYTVKKECSEWVQINLANKKSGYVAKEYVSVKTSFANAISTEEEQKKLVEEAAKKAAEKKAADAKKAAKKKAKKSSSSKKSSGKSDSKKSSTSIVSGDSFSATDKEIMYMACMIYCESGDQSFEGKLAVANVILNRCKSSNYADSIYGVLSQRGQFSPFRTGKFDNEIKKYKDGRYSSDSARKQCVKAAKAARDGDNNVGSRTSFNMKSSKNMSYKNSIVIGCHAFW